MVRDKQVWLNTQNYSTNQPMKKLNHQWIGPFKILKVVSPTALKLHPEVVAFTRALADSGKDRKAAMLERDVVDQLLDDDGFADRSEEHTSELQSPA